MIFQATGGVRLKEVLSYLQDWGLYEIFLPFLLIFSILFVVLQKIKIFKKEDSAKNKVSDRKTNGIVSFVLAVTIVAFHILGRYPENLDPVVMISTVLPGTIVIILAVLLVMILLGLVTDKKQTFIQTIASLVGIVILLGIVVFNVFPDLQFKDLGVLNDPNLQTLVVILLAFGITVYLIVHKKKGPDPTTPSDGLLKKLFYTDIKK